MCLDIRTQMLGIVFKKHNVLLRVIGFITCNREMISEHIS